MNLRRARLTAALFLALAAAGCFPPPEPGADEHANANTNQQTTPTPVVTAVKITYPNDGGVVEQTEVVRGSSQNVPNGQKIWVVIFVHKVGRYYPQNMPADVQASGNWDSVTYFGIPSDKGQKFDLLALTAEGGAQQAFDSYLSTARGSNKYPGLVQLPQGVTIHHRITVTRK